MHTKTIKSENMLRITDENLRSKLQEKFQLSPCTSVNSYFISILKNFAFNDTREDEILEKLENIEDTTNAIYEKVKNR